jgi:protein required for attachment to host cells
MGITWILAADRSRARLFEVVRHSDTPHEIMDLANPAGRGRERDIRSDNTGRFFGKGDRNQGNAATPDTLPSDHETERFADDIRTYLEHARNEKRFGQLWIVAAPAFLGLLRNKFGKQLHALVELEVNKDVTTGTPAEIFAIALKARGEHAEKEAEGEAGTSP